MIKTLALALCLVAFVSAQENCTGVTSDAFDDWCFASCNAVPRICPSTFCTCPSDNATAVICNAINDFEGLPGADDWCRLNCNFEPAFCPAQYCQCGDPVVIPPPPLMEINPFEPNCCAGEDRVLFYSEAGTIYKLTEGGVPEVCYEFDGGNPSSMEVDAAGNLWVADPVLGTVMRMSTECDNNTVTIVTSWIRDGVIDQPTALAFGLGGVIVSGSVDVYVMTLDLNGTVFEINPLVGLNATNDFQVRDIEIADGVIYFVSRNARVAALVPEINQFTFLDFHQHNVPDYGGITINDCGFYFTATDSNTIYFCPNGDPELCHVYCTGNETALGHPTCINTNNPTSIDSGCCCDIYVTNKGNGMVTVIRNNVDDTFPVLNETHIPEVLHANLTHPNAVAFWTEPSLIALPCDETCTA